MGFQKVFDEVDIDDKLAWIQLEGVQGGMERAHSLEVLVSPRRQLDRYI